MTEFITDNDLIITAFQNDDYNALIHFWDKTDMGYPERGDSKNTINKTIELGGCLLLLKEKSTGKILGSSWMTFDGRRILLHHFGILPECQGRGLSKYLLNQSLQFVKSKGYQVKLEIHSNNIKTINFYKKFGFAHLGEYNVYTIRDISKL